MKKEQCVFKISVPWSPKNEKLAKVIQPSLPSGQSGDVLKVSYTLDIHYLGEVADRLQAMMDLGCKGSSSNVLIKRVFKLLSESL